MKLFVGLGNVGDRYTQTRHNVGFMAVDWLAEQQGIDSHWIEKPRLMSFVNEASRPQMLLAKPTTLMNNSGLAVKKIMSYFKIIDSDLVIFHDDADLEIGDIRVSHATNSGAGHHGVLSIIEHVGQEFTRFRIGIGRPAQAKRDISDYVLGPLSAEQLKTIKARCIEKFQLLDNKEIEK